MRNPLLRFSIFPLVLLLFSILNCEHGDKLDVGKKAAEELELDKIPKVVTDALKAKFPKAEIQKWTEEKELDIVLYDIEFKQEGRKFEADIKENGMIDNWEKEIGASEVPEAVKNAVENQYPKSTPKEIMAITEVTEGKDALEGYEIVIETADRKEVEVTVAPDGTILEDPSEEK